MNTGNCSLCCYYSIIIMYIINFYVDIYMSMVLLSVLESEQESTGPYCLKQSLDLKLCVKTKTKPEIKIPTHQRNIYENFNEQ